MSSDVRVHHLAETSYKPGTELCFLQPKTEGDMGHCSDTYLGWESLHGCQNCYFTELGSVPNAQQSTDTGLW